MYPSKNEDSTGFSLFQAGLAVVSLVVLILDGRQGISAMAHQSMDDGLFIDQAISIASGNWLGDYSSLTFVKGPAFPIFLAVNFYVGLPILISQKLLYLLSGLVLIQSIQGFIKSRLYLLTIFCIYAFNPYLLAWSRITRESFYTSITVLIIASTISISKRIINRSQDNWQCQIAWNILLGILLAVFWMTREERIWIFPFVASLLTVSSIVSLKRFLKNRLNSQVSHLKSVFWFFSRQALAIGLAFFFTISPVLAANYLKYDALYVTEMQSPDFKAAYGALTRVKTPGWHPYVAVSNEARQKIYSISPRFKQLQPLLEGPSQLQWSRPGCKYYDVCDDIAGGWFLWAFRAAVETAGFYASPQTASTYFNALTQDIDSACLQHKIACYPARSSLAPRFDIRYLKPFLTAYLRGLKSLVSDGFSINTAKLSRGSSESIRLFESFLYSRANPSNLELADVIRGWAFGPNNQSYTVTIEENRLGPYTAQPLPSPNLAAYFNNDKLGHHRFEIRYFCQEGCKLRFLDKQGILVTEFDLENIAIPFRYDSPNISLKIDYFAPNSVKLSNLEKMKKAPFLGAIFWTYNYVIPIIFLIATSLWLLKVSLDYQITLLTCINILLLITIAFRLAILAVIDISSFPGIQTAYLMPCSPLLYIFMTLSLYEGGCFLRNRRESNPYSD